MSQFEQLRTEIAKGETASAFATALKAAMLINPLLDTQGERQHAFVPVGYTLNNVTDPDRLPGYIKQDITLDDRDSLIDYVNRFKGDQTVLVADVDAGEVCARIDYHVESADWTGIEEDDNGQTESGRTLGVPRHDRHRATLKLRLSEEFERWDRAEGEMFAQAEFAAFLEENAVDVIDPDGATLLEAVKDLEAAQGVNFSGKVDLTNGDRRFKYETETKQLNELILPKVFILKIAIYAGEPPVNLTAALRWSGSGAGIRFGFEWRRVKHEVLRAFRAVAEGAAEETGCPLVYGRAA